MNEAMYPDKNRSSITDLSAYAAIAEADPPFDWAPAEIGALAHLYRGEVYRSTIWRTRLDTTTNWAVVVTGIALSVTFSEAQATPLPLVLVGLLVMVFLSQEARRYRYFNVWRARARLVETKFYGPMLRDGKGRPDGAWNALLANDYDRPEFHISYARALGRRLRKGYCWIFTIQVLAYAGKLAVHPIPLNGIGDLLERANIGPVPGAWVLLAGGVFHSSWIVFALVTYRIELGRRRNAGTLIAMA